jgi:signal-transduction protein with cAMP-binding, CBS, and nucleotidyltransferase domain
MLSNKVSEIMTTNLTMASSSWSVLEVIEKMVGEDVGRIVVMDNEVPVGIFTEKDVLKRVVNQRDVRKTNIREVMTAPVRAVGEETHIVEAFGKMYKGKYRHLLVRGRRGKIVGIVSMRRILKIAVELGQGGSETKTLASIATTPPQLVDQSLSVYEAIDAMLRLETGAVVVTTGGEPLGIFTERDVLKKVAAKEIDSRKTLVQDVMTTPLVTMKSSALIGDALAEMYRRDIRNMPVMGESGTLVGIVSMPDVLQYARAFDIDEKVRQTWKEVEAYYESEEQYTPG